MESLPSAIAAYENTLEGNDSLYDAFTAKVQEPGYLKEHRDHIEKNRLGFGDRAFHYMWYLLMAELKAQNKPVSLLEIGVYKGQVISLWALLQRELKLEGTIYAVSPLEGEMPRFFLFKKIYKLLNKEKLKKGNLYQDLNYERVIRRLFEKFQLDFDAVQLMKGYSTDPPIIDQANKRSYDMIYIDGDHAYATVIADLKNYTPMLRPGGFLVMDDASFYLPMSSPGFKGHKEVSDAAKGIEEMGFENVLNVGHNRVYQKLS